VYPEQRVVAEMPINPQMPRAMLLGSLTVLIAAASWPSVAEACAYDQDGVSLERVALNILYPKAFHVLGAISDARIARRLPITKAGLPAADLVAYHRTARSLENLAKQLRSAAQGAPPTSFTLVLIEPMLWIRFEVADDLRMQVHVKEAQAEDLVLVSGEDVIREITANRLDIGEAERLGLIRLYGTETQVAGFLSTYAPVGSPPAVQSDGSNQ
jgi:hypothetical protein